MMLNKADEAIKETAHLEQEFQKISSTNNDMWEVNTEQEQDYENLKLHVLNNEKQIMNQILSQVNQRKNSG